MRHEHLWTFSVSVWICLFHILISGYVTYFGRYSSYFKVMIKNWRWGKLLRRKKAKIVSHIWTEPDQYFTVHCKPFSWHTGLCPPPLLEILKDYADFWLGTVCAWWWRSGCWFTPYFGTCVHRDLYRWLVTINQLFVYLILSKLKKFFKVWQFYILSVYFA